MAVNLPGPTGTSYYTKSSFWVSANLATCMMWLYPTSIPSAGNYHNAFGMPGQLMIDLHGSAWSIGSAVSDADGSTASANVWAHLALVRASTTSNTMYLNGVQDATSSDNNGNQIFAIGDWSGGNDKWAGRVARVKCWDAALTADEIKAEMRSAVPVRMAGLKFWNPMFNVDGNELTDYSGNGQTLVKNGTGQTTVDGPPVDWSLWPVVQGWKSSGAAGQTITLTGISNPATFGTLALRQTIALSGIAPTAAFGTLALRQNVVLSGIASTLAFGTLAAKLNLALSGIASTLAFGTLTLTVQGGVQTITLAGISNPATFGTLQARQNLALTGISNPTSFGTLALRLNLALSGIAPTAAFGTLTLRQNVVLVAIDPTATFGTLALRQNVVLAGVGSTLAFGTLTLDQSISLTGIASTLAFGTIVLTVQGQEPDQPGFSAARDYLAVITVARDWTDAINRARDWLASINAARDRTGGGN